MKYQKKKVFVEAEIWLKDGDHPRVRKSSKEELIHYFKVLPQNWDQFGVIDTLEGLHVVTPGDFIIKGVKGEYYACKPEIFWLTYEKTPMADIHDLARELHLKGALGQKLYNSLITLPDSENRVYQLGIRGIRFVLKSMV